MPVASRREVDGVAAEVEEASSGRVRAALLLIPAEEAEVVAMPPLGEVKRVGEVETAARRGDPTKTTTISTKGQIGGMAVHPFDPSSSSHRTFPLCTRNAKRPDTRSMPRDVAAPR